MAVVTFEAAALIGGERVTVGPVGEIRNPANTEELVGTYPMLTVAHVDAAVEAACRAQRAWTAIPIDERARLLVEAAGRIGAIEGLAELLVREQGKALWEAAFEVGFPAIVAAHFAEVGPEILTGETLVDDEQGTIRAHREPVGVVAAITPSNWPLALTYLKVVPALLAGNAVIVKPAPSTPLTVLRASEEFAAALPPGLVSVVTGDVDSVGRRLLEHPLVRMVSFTGGTATGKVIAQQCAASLKTVALELGGNDAALLLDDVTITPELLVGLVTGTYMTSGQVCFAVKRIFVPTALHDQLVEGMLGILDGYVVGPGLDPSSTIGPLHSAAGRDRVRSLVDDARGRGGVVHAGGKVVGDDQSGFFVQPTIVTGLDIGAPLVAEEQFGPALPVLAYDDLDDAISQVNATEYGLCSSIWSADDERASALARRVEAGCTFINNHGLASVDLRAPMGGVKQSGIGREMGREGLLAYTECHTVSNRRL